MSPKLVAILVLAILSVSIVVTGAAAIAAAQGADQAQPVARPSGEQGEGDSALMSTFQFVVHFTRVAAAPVLGPFSWGSPNGIGVTPS